MDYKDMKPIGLVRLMLTDGVITQEQAAKYFPELKESEDERMVKFIKKQLFNIKKTITDNYELDTELTKAIDWLENQGEQKPVIDDKDAEKAAEEYRNFRMSCGIKDPIMLNEIEEAYYEGAISEQKPVEWSEEDGDIRDNIIRDLKRLGGDMVSPNQAYQKEIQWLKSLKDRVLPQPKQEWSEEDKSHLDSIIFFLESCLSENPAKIAAYLTMDDVNCLKSLRQKLSNVERNGKNWKPSEKQLEALDFAVDCVVPPEFCFKRKELKELLEQLKAL